MPRLLRLSLFSLGVALVIVACGSRTGLDTPEPGCTENEVDCEPQKDAEAEDQGVDQTLPPDARPDRQPEDGPLFEGGPLDVVTDCPDPPYCDPRDPGFVYKCGVRIVQCSSLEQCEQEIGRAHV